MKCSATLCFVVAIGATGLMSGCESRRAPMPATVETFGRTERENAVSSGGRNDAPDDLTSRLNNVRQLVEENRYDAALLELDYILKSQPDNISALLIRSRALLRTDRPRDAERSLRRVAQLEPGNLDAKLMLGYCYLDQKQWDRAERSLAEVAYSEGTLRQRVSAYLGLASVYENQGQKELVSACYREAIDLDESVAEILMQAERRFFWPNPVRSEEGRLSRSSPSMREIEKVIGEVKKAPR